jgi:hypothetical protein
MPTGRRAGQGLFLSMSSRTMPQASAKAPTTGRRGILFVSWAVTSTGPRSMTFSRVV